MAYKRKRSSASYSRGGRRRPYRRYNYSSSYRRAYPRVYGRGDYRTTIRNAWNTVRKRFSGPYTGRGAGIGHTLGGTIGEFIAPGIGGTVGGALGAGAGYLTDKIMGWGDYEIKQNTIAIPKQARGVPSFGKGCIRITHKEYIASINSSSAFTISQVALNPGLTNSFPWLSQIAQNFEQYRWNGMVFEFKSTSADALNSTNTALGKIILATDYNASDEPFVSPQQMMGTEFSNLGKPSNDILHAIECAPSQQATKFYWIRTGVIPPNSDIKLYDHGNFYVAAVGSQATAVVGDLWVTYDVTLCKPVQNNVVGYSLPVAHFSLEGVDNGNHFGTDFTPNVGTNLPVRIDSDTLYFPTQDDVGTYYISYSCQGGSTALTTPTVSPVRCVVTTMFNQDSQTGIDNGTGNTSTKFLHNFVVQISAPQASITYASGVLPTTVGNKADLYVFKIPFDLT